MVIRYSNWDGTQNINLFDADDLLEAISDDVIKDGDLRRALEATLRRLATDYLDIYQFHLAGIEPARLAEFFAERMTPEEEDRLRNLVAEQVDSTSHSP